MAQTTTTRRGVLIGLALVALAGALAVGRSGPATRPLDGEAAAGPVRVLAVRPNNPSAVLIDLGRATETHYGRTAGMPRDAVDGAVITPRGDVAVWADGTVHLLTGEPVRPDRRIRPRALRRWPGTAPALTLVPSGDGDGVWLVQPGIAGTHPTLAEFVDLDHGPRHGPFVLDPPAQPVGAAGTGLVLNMGRSGDSERVVLLSREGALTEVAPGRAVAADAGVVVRQVCPTGHALCDWHASAPDGSGDRLLPSPPDTYWTTVGGPAIPTNALPLPALSPDGSRLLAAAVPERRGGAGVTGSALHAVELSSGTSVELLRTAGPLPLATWSADGRWIVMIEGPDLLLVPASGAAVAPRRLAGMVPPEHFVLAAGP